MIGFLRQQRRKNTLWKLLINPWQEQVFSRHILDISLLSPLLGKPFQSFHCKSPPNPRNSKTFGCEAVQKLWVLITYPALSGQFHDTCWNPPWNAPGERQEEFLGCISLRPQCVPYAPTVEEKGAGYTELPLENPSFPAGGTARAYQCFPGLSSWKEFTAQGTVVVQRRDKPSLAVLTSHSCYQRIRGLWSPSCCPPSLLPLESTGGALPARHWVLLFHLGKRLDKIQMSWDCIFQKVLTEQVLSIQTPSWEIPQHSRPIFC